jgi:hypothetical protein
MTQVRPRSTQVTELTRATESDSVWLGRGAGASWTRTDEAAGSDLWTVLATPTAQRRGVARDFASTVGGVDGVGAIWVTDLKSDLDVVIVLADLNLESEVRNAFIDLVCERLDPTEGELFVFPEGEVPAWVENGERLI